MKFKEYSFLIFDFNRINFEIQRLIFEFQTIKWEGNFFFFKTSVVITKEMCPIRAEFSPYFQECIWTVLDASSVNTLYGQHFFSVQMTSVTTWKIWNNLIQRFLDFMCKCINSHVQCLIRRYKVCNALASTLWNDNIIFIYNVITFLRFKFSSQLLKNKIQQVFR